MDSPTQKTNTFLLLVIVALLIALSLKPVPGRYEVFRYGSLAPAEYLLDTATGREVLIQVSDAVKADQRAKETAKQAEKNAEKNVVEARDKAYKEERLSKNCPEVLAEPAPKMATRKKGSLRDVMDEALLDEQKKECQEWLRSKAAESQSKSSR